MNLQDQIRHVLTNRGWGLIADGDELAWQTFVNEVVKLIGQADSATSVDQEDLKRAVIGAYCPVLHAACADDGSQRQQRAFEELWQWIFPRVHQRVDTAQDAEDVAQQVMLKVSQKLHQVHDPTGFLAWVNTITFHTLSQHYRRQGRRGQFEELSIDAAQDTGALDALIGTENVLKMELSVAEEELVRMIYDCMPKGRRRQAELLVALVLQELTVAEVAEKFQTTPANVYVLNSRAREGLLKHCKDVVKMLIQHLTLSQQRDRAEADS